MSIDGLGGPRRGSGRRGATACARHVDAIMIMARKAATNAPDKVMPDKVMPDKVMPERVTDAAGADMSSTTPIAQIGDYVMG